MLREINTSAGSVFDVHAVVAHGVVELRSQRVLAKRVISR